MAIFKFYQIYRSLKEELGEEMAARLFPEYSTLPDKMPAHEQAKLGKEVMSRLDMILDKDTIKKIRQKHCCNPSKEQIAEIKDIKEKTNNLDEFCSEYSKLFSPGYVDKSDNLITFAFGLTSCVCGMFRKLENYEPMTKTWCECCNGHVIKMFSLICDKPVSSEIEKAIVCGGEDCVFKITV